MNYGFSLEMPNLLPSLTGPKGTDVVSHGCPAKPFRGERTGNRAVRVCSVLAVAVSLCLITSFPADSRALDVCPAGEACEGATDDGVLLPLSAGQQLSIDELMGIIYGVGFITEDNILTVLDIAVSASDLWTKTRRWEPELGLRPAGDAIGVQGPSAAWGRQGRQFHSNRGLWQFSSFWWADYADEIVDDPVRAASLIYEMSEQGKDFSFWASYIHEREDDFYDRPQWGRPALRPVVRDFLSRVSRDEVITTSASAVDTLPSSEQAFVHPIAEGLEASPDPTVGEPVPAGENFIVVQGLEGAASAGNRWAQIGLAEILIESKNPADPTRAITLLEQASASGLSGPASEILTDYYREIGDYDKALIALETVEGVGSSRARFLLGETLLKEHESSAAVARGITLLKEAAEAGFAGPAFRLLGRHFIVAGDDASATSALEMAVEAGDGEAKFLLATVLKKDKSNADSKRIRALLEEALAVGYGPARIVFANLLIENGTKSDREKARTLLQTALKEDKELDAYRGLILLEADVVRRNRQSSQMMALLRDAYAADSEMVFASIDRLQENDKVAVMQAILHDAKLYSGPVDGRLTKSTLNAIARFCREQNIEECRSEAMPPALLPRLLSHLASAS